MTHEAENLRSVATIFGGAQVAIFLGLDSDVFTPIDLNITP